MQTAPDTIEGPQQVDATPAPKQRKPGSGAPKGNSNRVKHGARGVLTLSRAPKGSGHTYSLVSTFRRELVAAVTKLHGAVSLQHEAQILTVCRLELCLKLYEAWARKAGRTEEDRLKAAETAAGMSERRDKAIERLLGSKAAPDASAGNDPWNALNANPIATDPQ